MTKLSILILALLAGCDNRPPAMTDEEILKADAECHARGKESASMMYPEDGRIIKVWCER